MKKLNTTFTALAVSGAALLAGCSSGDNTLPPPAQSVGATQLLNAMAVRTETFTLHPFMQVKKPYNSVVVGLEGCRQFGISMAHGDESLTGHPTADVTCTTQDNHLAARYICISTSETSGDCVRNGHVARETLAAKPN